MCRQHPQRKASGTSWSHGVTNPKMRHLNSLLAALLKMPFKTVEGLLSP